MSQLNSLTIDRIELMQTFVRIVDSGSLSAAARQLGTTQPTISRRLKTLEKLLGTELILRSTHGRKLTDDGERCYAHARTLIEQWSELEDGLRGAGEEPMGRLRVRAPHAFGQDQMIRPLSRYLQRYPGVSIDWMLNDHSPDFIADNIDCAIHVGSVTDPSVIAVLLAEVPRIVVAAPALLEQSPPIEQVQDLERLPWVALSTYYRNEVTLVDRRADRSQQLNIRPRVSTDSLYALRQSALEGLGVAIVSTWIVQEDLEAGRLVRIQSQWCAHPLPIYLLYPYAAYYPARLRTFIDLMREVMPTMAGTRPPGV
ncbi:LysR family transcriptional regulator [Marinobacter sp. NFXS9]